MAMEKTFDAASAEARLIREWENAGAFRAGANARRDESFCIMIPPPNVTGSLHMGHAFNNTLQDILVRWKRMQGYDVLWQPGTDHAGIATQMVTEREMAANGEPTRAEMGRERFLERVWQQKVKSRGTIIGQLKRLGASCDWSREAFTMGGAQGDPDAGSGPNFHDAVIKVFVDMYNKGLIYRGKRLVNWDPHFETAISDLEVENIEVDGHMWHFKYPLAGGATYEYVERDAEGNVTLRETRNYISIATTRPETMLGDGAVAVHPSDTRYAPIVGQLCEIPVGPKEHRRLIPIITDEYPDPDFGSGAVKITGAHDFNDYGVAKRNNIPLFVLLDGRGKMRADGHDYSTSAKIATEYLHGRPWDEYETTTLLNIVPDHLRGLDRFEARKRVVEEITAEGLAVMTRADDPRLGRKLGEDDDPAALVPLVEAKKIMQPFGDRSKVVIEPMLTGQWFVDAEKVVGPALEAVRSGAVKIVPESGEKTYYHWLENIEPWCISRQLWWGHQIPVWYALPITTERGQLMAQGADDVIASLEKSGKRIDSIQRLGDESDIDKKYGVKDNILMFCAENLEAARKLAEIYIHEKCAWLGVDSDQFVVEEITPDSFDHQKKTSFQLQRDPDVLDTWFSSGLWPIGTLGWPEDTPELKKYFPTSVLVTGQDILFFWVARMMMMQLAVVNDIPFRHVYLHGLVRDAKGKKMSKSLGNVIDPLEIIDDYGADALRFANAAMASLGGVLKLDTQRIAGYRNFATKLWNATRFAEMNGVFAPDVPAPGPLPPKATATANRWIVGETARTLATVNAALDAYRFNDAALALYQFVWGKVCDWYVEFAKPLLDGDDAAETRATMRWVLDQCYILLHPIMPFVTEELWGQTGTRARMLVHADWPAYGTDIADPAADREMGWAIGLIEAVRSARAQMRVPVGLKLPMLQLDADAAARAAYAANAALIEKLARIDGLHPADSLPRGALSIAVEGASFALPLEGVIDVAAETARLEKAREKLMKEVGGLKGRLENPRFVANADPAVVDEARAALAEKQDEAARLDQALARLAALA